MGGRCPPYRRGVGERGVLQPPARPPVAPRATAGAGPAAPGARPQSRLRLPLHAGGRGSTRRREGRCRRHRRGALFTHPGATRDATHRLSHHRPLLEAGSTWLRAAPPGGGAQGRGLWRLPGRADARPATAARRRRAAQRACELGGYSAVCRASAKDGSRLIAAAESREPVRFDCRVISQTRTGRSRSRRRRYAKRSWRAACVMAATPGCVMRRSMDTA